MIVSLNENANRIFHNNLHPPQVVLRRLPVGMQRDELFAQLQPLEPHAFWFCAADAELAHARCSYARAYLVFRDEKQVSMGILFVWNFSNYFLKSMKNDCWSIDFRFSICF